MSTLKKYILIMSTYLILIVAVFTVSQYSGELTVKIKKLQHDITDEKATISILNAEWAYLNTPQHIEDLAMRYIKLKPTSAKQVISIKTLLAKIKVMTDKDKKKELYLERVRKKHALYLANIRKKKRALYLARKRKTKVIHKHPYNKRHRVYKKHKK